MALLFQNNLAKTLDTYEKWWNGDLDRVLLPVAVVHSEPSGTKPKYRYCSQSMFADKSITPKEIVDCAEYMLSHTEFFGDFYPNLDQIFSGPGIVAAFLGAEVTVNDGNIWFSAGEPELYDLHFEYDPNNYWLNRVKEIITEGKRRWGAEVVLGMPDLGGALDILASFRTTENLLFDLYDSPAEVERLTGEIHDLWHVYYNEIAELYAKDQAYMDWSNLLGRKPSYMLQCDFCYMIGPDMFDAFVKPELTESCRKLSRGCYHLDGTGQLTHLSSLLEIEELRLIQWVPGDGVADESHWAGLYDKILNSGKLLQVDYYTNDYINGGSFTQLDKIIERRGSLKGVSHRPVILEDKDEALRLLEKYGVE
jgi:5-methyltetrahydrofolate--homocysteine methyltransferase